MCIFIKYRSDFFNTQNLYVFSLNTDLIFLTYKIDLIFFLNQKSFSILLKTGLIFLDKIIFLNLHKNRFDIF